MIERFMQYLLPRATLPADAREHRGHSGFDRPGPSEPGYAICTTPRSGSNFLCQLLASTDCLGHPLEYFNAQARRTLDDAAYPDDAHEQILKIRSVGATGNGLYGLKLFPHQHDAIREQVSWLEALPNLCFVSLERLDTLGQAISWARAIQTGQYRSTSASAGHPSFDRALIASRLADIVREQARWKVYFARTGIEPVRIVYEDMIAAPGAAVASVARLFDLEAQARPDVSRVNVARQRDELNEAWRARFIAEAGDPSHIDPL